MPPKKKKKEKREDHPLSKVNLEAKRIENALCGEFEIHGRKIQTPNFIHEIEGREDLFVLIKNHNLLKEAKIISIPAFRWQSLVKSVPPLNKELHDAGLSILFNHHVIMYEPPELFHNLMPQALIRHAFRGNIGPIRKFYRLAVVENNIKDALAMLPDFEREFIKTELHHLLSQRYKKMTKQKQKSLAKIKKIPKTPKERARIEDAWLNTKKSFLNHVAEGAIVAKRYPSTSFIPAVKTLNASSSKADRDFVVKQNNSTAFLWRERLDGPYYSSGRIWFHISLNKTVLTSDGDTGNVEIIDIVNKSFKPIDHAGVCLTMQGWEDVFFDEKGRKKLQTLTNEIADIANQYNRPFYAARSKWVGIYLIDDGLSFPGAMLNGNEKLHSGAGGMSAKDPKIFGRVAIYGFCRELPINELFDIGKRPGEFSKPKRFHHIEGIPDSCPLEYQYDAKKFRQEFGKLRNFATHTVEVDEIRKALLKGQRKPAREYIKKSDLMKGIR